MQHKKILVVGYFGHITNQLDGETIKTRNVYELIKEKEKEYSLEVDYFDTQTFQTDKRNVMRMFRKIVKTDILIYIAAHNNLKYFFPIHYLLSKLKRIDIHYIVVGGWLADFISTKPLHISMLRKIKGIYPQTELLTTQLQERYQFQNVYQLNNFRMGTSSLGKNRIPAQRDHFKLVFMARVHPLKGMDVLFRLADHLRKTGRNNVFIDIYGPVFGEYQIEFEEKLEQHRNVKYKGVLQPEEITEKLHAYDFMLFPTQYYTEGFPGSILDAYIAGIPVIATRWKYAEEFIEDNVNGIITDFDDPVQFIEKTLFLIDHPQELIRLKGGVRDIADKYSPEEAWRILRSRILSLTN